ncbi:MAG: hypothetical protein ACFE8P_14240 [Promethearchaeota archaeon]
MSEEIFLTTIENITNIYRFLTEQEPSPDDEIEARNNLLTLFHIVSQNNTRDELSSLIERIIDELENWDTLELWFKEVTSLSSSIKDLINAVSQDSPEIEELPVLTESLESAKVESSEDPAMDIMEIVAQVSDQFKDQIESLKGKIEDLQAELEKKTEMIAQIEENIVQGDNIGSIVENDDLIEQSTQIFEPKKPIHPEKERDLIFGKSPPVESKKMRLEPPKIHIPLIKRREPKHDIEIEPPISETPITTDEKSVPAPEAGRGIEIPDQYVLKPEVQVEDSKVSELTPIPTFGAPITGKEQKVESSVKGTGDLVLTPVPTLSKTEGLGEEKKPNITVKDTQAKIGLTPIPTLENMEELEEEDKEKSKEFMTKRQESIKRAGLTPIPVQESPEIRKQQSRPKIKIGVEEIQQPKSQPPLTALPIQDSKASLGTKTAMSAPVETNKHKKPKIVSSVVEEEATRLISKTPETFIFMPESSKKSSESPQLPERPVETSLEEIPSMNITKPVIKIEDMDVEHLKTSKDDLFNVFSSVQSQESEKIEFNEVPIEKQLDEEDKKKKKKKKKQTEEIPPKATYQIPKKDIEEEIIEESSMDFDNLPQDKDVLYQDLIALEGKRYSIEKRFKELKEEFSNKKITKGEFKKQGEQLGIRLKQISVSINKIRNAISKL